MKAVCDKSPLSLPVHVPCGLPWDRRGREQGPAGIQPGFPIVRGLGRASREEESIPDQAGPAKEPFTLQLYLLWKSKRRIPGLQLSISPGDNDGRVIRTDRALSVPCALGAPC